MQIVELIATGMTVQLNRAIGADQQTIICNLTPAFPDTNYFIATDVFPSNGIQYRGYESIRRPDGIRNKSQFVIQFSDATTGRVTLVQMANRNDRWVTIQCTR